MERGEQEGRGQGESGYVLEAILKKDLCSSTSYFPRGTEYDSWPCVKERRKQRGSTGDRRLKGILA